MTHKMCHFLFIIKKYIIVIKLHFSFSNLYIIMFTVGDYMAKEKKLVLEQNKKELTFYYELIGVITILISLIALARLGVVGYYIMMIFRITFGDWYFAFLLALLLYGIYCLFKHHSISVKNMRSIGVILMMVGILTISHFPMHNYISQFGDNHLKMTFSLYLDYLKNYQEGAIVGGGIIGMLFFYAFYMLFSSVGTIVIVCFLFVVGVSFSFNKTIGESLIFFKRIINKIFNIFARFGKTIKYGIKVTQVTEKKPKKDKKITIDLLTEPYRQNYIITEEKHAVGLKKSISAILNNMNVFYNNVSYLVAEHVTTCTIDTVSNINLDKLYMRLKSVLSERFLITKDIDSPKIKIEIDNVDTNPPFLKTMFVLQSSYLNNLKLPIGIDTNNEIVELNLLERQNVLYIEENIDLVIKVFAGYIIMFMIKLIKINYQIILLDIDGQASKLHKNDFYVLDFNNELVILKKEVERRLELLNANNCNNIEEYNRKTKDHLDYKMLFIMNCEKLIMNQRRFEDLMYILQMGIKVGYYSFVHYMGEEVLSNVVDSLFDVKMIGKQSNKNGISYLGINPDNYLFNDEAFYIYKDELFRFSMAKCSEEEMKKILKSE